jgi:hypothetical protein
MLMQKDFRALAKHYVQLSRRPRSEEEIVRLLQERVARVTAAQPSENAVAQTAA